MRNQYFGDERDYHKYGLLRTLTGAYPKASVIPALVAWMLTANDGQGHGGQVGYLNNPDCWRGRDSDLFDCLNKAVVSKNRNVGVIETSGLLPHATFDIATLPKGTGSRQPNFLDDAQARASYFDQILKKLDGQALVFFDPDNGMAGKTTSEKGQPGSSKYLFEDELVNVLKHGCPVLLFQYFFFPQDSRSLGALVRRLQQTTHLESIVAVQTNHVSYILLPQGPHATELEHRAKDFTAHWAATHFWTS